MRAELVPGVVSTLDPSTNRSQVDTLVIGAGQAGLAVGYHLRRRDLSCVIVDEQERVGDVWRKRWDSLRLFTPGRYDGLPGMPFPGPPSAYPTKDEIAEYFETYARQFGLPVRTGLRVERLSAVDGRFEAFCGGHKLTAENVVVATGALYHPRVPAFAAGLDAAVVQLHSHEYRNRSQLQPGSVLVVGAGNSGAEIAMELARAPLPVLAQLGVVGRRGPRRRVHRRPHRLQEGGECRSRKI